MALPGLLIPALYQGAARFGVPAVRSLLGRTSLPALGRTNLPALIPNSAANQAKRGLLGTIGAFAKKRPFTTATLGTVGLGGVNELAGFPVANQFFTGGGDGQTPANILPGADKPPFEKQTSGMIPQQDMTTDQASQSSNAGGNQGGFLSNLSGLFSDNDRLARVAMGISLLEGRPITDAVAISDFIKSSGTAAGGDIDTVVIDRETQQPVAYGNKGDANIKRYAQEPDKFRIVDRDEETRQSDAIDLQTIKIRQESGAKFIDKAYENISGTLDNKDLIQKLIMSLKSGDLETGAYAELRKNMIRLLGESDKIKDEELLESFNTFLTTEVAATVAGALSNQELDLFSESQPGLSRGTETNIALLERKLTLLDIAQAKIKYVSDALDEGKRHTVAGLEFDEKFQNDLDFKAEVLNANLINNVDAVISGDVQLESGRYYVNDLNSDRFGTYYTVD